MNRNWVAAIILATLAAGAFSADASSQLFNQLCTNSSLSAFNVSDADRVTLRANGQQYALNISVIMGLVGGSGSYTEVVKGGATIILSILLLVVIIITIFGLMFFCCCCDHADNPSDKTAKICMGISMLLLLVTVIFFIIAMVYLGKFNSTLGSASCFVAKLPNDMVNGYSSPNLTFIGLSPLKTIITNLASDIGSLSSFTSNFDQIIALKLPDSTSKAYSDLEVFYNQYKSSQTFDGTGNKATPLSVSSLTKEVNAAVGTELTVYKIAGGVLDGAAQAGKNFTTGNGTAQIQSTLNQVAGLIQNYTNIFLNFSSNATPTFNSTSTYIPIGLYITISFGVLLTLLFILALAIMCCSISQKKNLCRCGIKLCLLIVGLMTLIVSIIVIVMFMVSFVVGTVCVTMPVILTQNNITTWINSLNVSSVQLTGSTGDLINTCLAQGGQGDLSSVFMGNTDSSYLSAQNFLTNISDYNALKNNFTLSGPNSYTIGNTTQMWGLFRDCLLADHPAANQTLIQLNQGVSCGNLQIVLNSQNCTTGASTTCVDVKNTNAWTPPSCASNPSDLQTKFNNLKAFCTDENTLLSQMVNGLGSTSVSTTPMSQVIKYKQDFSTAFPLFDQVVSAMSRTLDSVKTVTSGLGKSLNCTVLRQELLDLESVMCFNTSKNLASFANWLALFVLLILMTIYGFCCTLRCTWVPESDIAYEPVDTQAQGNQVYGGKDQMYRN